MGDHQLKEASMEQTKAVVARHQADIEPIGDLGASAEVEHPEPNRAGEPKQQQQPESDRAKEQEK